MKKFYSKKEPIYLLALSFILFSCEKVKVKKNEDNPYTFNVPDYIPKSIYNFENNPFNNNGFNLGKLLFYDPILSSDSSVSCANCHNQAHAFADHNLAFSVGVNNKIGLRNSPPIFNLAWHPNFMWDGGVNHIEIMPLAPITNHLEMNETMANVINKLNRNTNYRKLFKTAFSVDSIDDQKLFFAITQFMGKIHSFGSKYDKVKQGKEQFTNEENKGYVLFKTHCNSCHSEPLFSEFEYANNGIDSVFKDKGRYLITLNHSDEGLFKTPSLRNVALTYPYMHDGRFRTLQEVLNHYSNNIKKSKTLDRRLSAPLKLKQDEIQQLILFLNTLSDYEFINNKLYSEP